jgi:hypothetical protein
LKSDKKTGKSAEVVEGAGDAEGAEDGDFWKIVDATALSWNWGLECE